MRFPFLAVCLVLLAFSAYSQSKKLPEILVPGAAYQAEADLHGYRVFKILQRGTYENPPDSYKDEDNPLGIRQGGAYFSFSTASHSYNKIPQIGLEKEWILVGFYGASLGYLYDVGKTPLSDISMETPAAKALGSFVPPVLDSEVRSQRNVLEVGGYNFTFRRMDYAVGNSYLLRAVSSGEADKMVAINIAAKHDDGSLTIYWRPLKEFPVRKLLYQTDEQLSELITAGLNDPRFEDVKFSVSENEVTLKGSVAREDYQALMSILQNARARGIKNQVTTK